MSTEIAVIELKIGRKTFCFNEQDKFMDNGSCIQCLTHIGVYSGWGRYANLVITKKAVKEISGKCDRVPHSDTNGFGSTVTIFTLKLKEFK